MIRHVPKAGRLLLLIVLLSAPAAVSAQELHTYTVGLLGGIGGSTDVKPGRSFTNSSFQLNFGRIVSEGTEVAVRLGHLGLDAKPTFGSLTSAGLDYVTLAGEYKFDEGYYTSGVYVGLGAYRLGGTSLVDGSHTRQTAAGGSVGLTGDFRLNRWLGVLVELSGHYVDLREAKIFGMAHGGVAVHF